MNYDYDYDEVIKFCTSADTNDAFQSSIQDLKDTITALEAVQNSFHSYGVVNSITEIYNGFSEVVGYLDSNSGQGEGMSYIVYFASNLVNTCYLQAMSDKEMLEGGYTVAKGDTLSAIARKYNVSVADLVAANGITNPNLIVVGQEIKIPGQGGNTQPTPTGEDNIQPIIDDNKPTTPTEPTTPTVPTGTTTPGTASPGCSETPHSAQAYNLSDEEFRILCATVYAEAAEGNEYCYSDTMGVTSTILNRVEAGNYGGSSVTAVVSAPSQFSGYGYQNTKFSRAMNDPSCISETMMQAIRDTLNGQRNTDGYSFRGRGQYNTFF